MAASTPAGLLEAALAADPSRPLLTAYDDETAERTELSVVTFANWVAKTANLLRDELGIEPGGTLALRLPLHWQAAVWVHAAWGAGLAVDLAPREATGHPPPSGGPAPREVDVAVIDHPTTTLDVTADEVVSLGLGPMGLPRPGITPAFAGALDYDRAVHSHGDRFTSAGRPDPGAPAMRQARRAASARALLEAAAAPPPGRLLLTQPLDAATTVVGALLTPLAHGTGTVLCRNLDPTVLPARIAQENLAATLTPDDTTGGLLPAWTSPEPPMS